MLFNLTYPSIKLIPKNRKTTAEIQDCPISKINDNNLLNCCSVWKKYQIFFLFITSENIIVMVVCWCHFSGAEDIVNGNRKLVLGLVWQYILRYQIGKTEVSIIHSVHPWQQRWSIPAGYRLTCQPAIHPTDQGQRGQGLWSNTNWIEPGRAG